jgi:tRNA pseudouridine55 synthase
MVVATADTRPTPATITAALSAFIGEIQQRPPAFSAIKIDGERAYDLARAGAPVELEPRTVVIDALRLISTPDAETAVFEAECGKGTYVRAIARDLGRLLGCRGHVMALRRTAVGTFDEGRAVSFDQLKAAVASGDPARLAALLEPVEAALDDLTALPVSSDDAARLVRGQSILIRGRDAPILTGPAFAVCKGRLVALGELERGELRPTRVFNA